MAIRRSPYPRYLLRLAGLLAAHRVLSLYLLRQLIRDALPVELRVST
jgi:hypothetical protein